MPGLNWCQLINFWCHLINIWGHILLTTFQKAFLGRTFHHPVPIYSGSKILIPEMLWVKFSVMIVSHCWTGKRLERVILQTKTFGEVWRGQACPRSTPTRARLPSFSIGHLLHSSWPDEEQGYALYWCKCTSALSMLSNFPNKFLNFSLDSPCSSLMRKYICCNISWGVAWEV